MIFDYISPILFTVKRPPVITSSTSNAIINTTPDHSNNSNKSVSQTRRHPHLYYTLFHSSFVDWFTDVKFSTHKYFHSLTHTHLLLAYYNYDKLTQLAQLLRHRQQQQQQKTTESEKSNQRNSQLIRECWSKFRFHFFNSSSSSNSSGTNNSSLNLINEPTLSYLYLLFDYDYEYKICMNTLERKLLQCKKLLNFEDDNKIISPQSSSSSSSSSSSAAVISSSSRRQLIADDTTTTTVSSSSTSQQSRRRDSSLVRSRADYESSIYDLFRLVDSAPTVADESKLRNELFELVRRLDLSGLKHKLSADFRSVELVRRTPPIVDDLGQTLALVAVAASKSTANNKNNTNAAEIIDYLVRVNPTLVDYSDASSGWTTLRYSAWIGNESVVRVLLENGAQVDASDCDGRTALRAAVFSGHDHVARLLIKYGANGNIFINLIIIIIIIGFSNN